MTVAKRIAHVIARFTAAPHYPRQRTTPDAAIMHLLRPPSTTLEAYIQRLIDYTYCTPECFVIAAVYTIRVVASGAIAATPLTIHRMLGAALLVAVKARDDHLYTMSYYSRVIGVPCAELHLMELFVLKALSFNTFVGAHDYTVVVEAMLEVDCADDAGWQHHLVAVPPNAMSPELT